MTVLANNKPLLFRVCISHTAHFKLFNNGGVMVDERNKLFPMFWSVWARGRRGCGGVVCACAGTGLQVWGCVRLDEDPPRVDVRSGGGPSPSVTLPCLLPSRFRVSFHHTSVSPSVTPPCLLPSHLRVSF
eukprot:21208-Prorocentrum_minimum.AAC.1